ncbi:hypothetical protein [Roseovarius aestuarii]|uniref:Uncharacterized protein n=1 Tax=Roseovarius aestuarii TaxID=475083 RepID=A0A1X7BWK3_9RHOB|nr:hypothetical protein [Roseovarius aestuarii]SMC13609.1 hypothetical protein ROA7745_03466 [Roseovarius aestuarii]
MSRFTPKSTIQAILLALLPGIASAEMTCNLVDGDKLFLSAGEIIEARILTGTHVKKTGVSGPKIHLFCEKRSDDEIVEMKKRCPKDVADVQVNWDGEGSVSAACLRRTFQEPKIDPTPEEPEIPKTGGAPDDDPDVPPQNEQSS